MATRSAVPNQAPELSGGLDRLDEALMGIRRVFQRPGFRRRLLASLSRDVELATYRLLRAIQRADDAPSVGEVAETLTVDPSTASRMVDRAVDSGYVERQACADDRRRARLHLTVPGRELLDEATGRRRELLADVTDAWEPGDLACLVDLLDRLQAGFDRLEGSA